MLPVSGYHRAATSGKPALRNGNAHRQHRLLSNLNVQPVQIQLLLTLAAESRSASRAVNRHCCA